MWETDFFIKNLKWVCLNDVDGFRDFILLNPQADCSCQVGEHLLPPFPFCVCGLCDAVIWSELQEHLCSAKLSTWPQSTRRACHPPLPLWQGCSIRWSRVTAVVRKCQLLYGTQDPQTHRHVSRLWSSSWWSPTQVRANIATAQNW